MSEEGLLEQLLSNWGSERAKGRAVTAQELCAGHPELLVPLQRRIEAVQRLEELERGVQHAAADPMLTTNEEPSKRAVTDTPTAPPFVAPLSPLTAAPAELDPRKYKLIETLGQGGMGEVYRSCDPSLGRDLAIKVIRADCRNHPTVELRFLREARITGSLQHPNIVAVHNLGRLPDGRLHYTMRLVRGQTLAQILKDETGKPERLPALLGIFEKICQAVAYAHSRRVLHRDLKPANVMIGRFGEVQVMDWGLAKLLSSDNDMTVEGAPEDGATVIRSGSADTPLEATQLGSALGTPAYMAPEQAAGDWEVVDERADVFALGAILCEILTGAPPYRAANALELLRRARRGDLVDALARLEQGGADAALTALCRDCLNPDREARPRDAGVVAQHVADYQAEVQERLRQAELERVAAEARAREEQARAAAERRARQRTLALAGALLVLLAGGVAGIVAITREQQRTATERDEKQKALDVAEQQAAIATAVNEFLQKGLLGQADIGQQTVGPDGKRDPDVKVRTLLDRASESIKDKFPEQPLTEAAIRLTMGNAYKALGRYAESQPHLERSLKLRTAQLGADHPDTLTSKNDLAKLYRHQGKYDLAESLFKEAVQGRTTQLGADHPDTLTSKNDLAELYSFLRKYDLAEPLYKEVVEGRTTQLGADHPDTLTSKNDLAVLYHFFQGKLELAEPLYKEVVPGMTAKLGADHPSTMDSKHNLAVLYLDQGKYDLAESLHKEVLEAMTAKLGADHPDTLTVKNNLAVLYENLGKYGLAEPLFKEVLQTRTTKFGPDHLETQISKSNLAMLYWYQRKYDLAERLFKEALRGQLALSQAENPYTLNTMEGLGHTLLRQKKYAEAEPMLRQCLALRDKKEADWWTTFYTRSLLGEALMGQKKYTDAEPLLLQGYDGMKEREKHIPAQMKVRLSEGLERLVQLYDAWGKKDKADDYRQKLAAERAQAKPSEPRP